MNQTMLSKTNLAGAKRFDVAVDFPDGVFTINGIAIHHSSGDICVVGQGANSVNREGILAIYKQAPIALADSFLAVKGNQTFISPKTVTTNDRQWQGAAITLTQNATNGTLNLLSNGVFHYTPNPGYTGFDTFKYRLTKAGLTPLGEALVTLKVVP